MDCEHDWQRTGQYLCNVEQIPVIADPHVTRGVVRPGFAVSSCTKCGTLRLEHCSDFFTTDRSGL